MIPIFPFLGTLVGAFFGFKGEQAKTLQKTIDVVNNLNVSDQVRDQAAASIITAEVSNGYWLAGVWRPILMMFFAGLIGARWFGYMPVNMSEAELMKVYDLLQLGIGGYIGGRTLEKVVGTLNLGKIIREFTNKKVG